MQQDGQLTRDCDYCAFLPALASVLSQFHAPSAQVAVEDHLPQPGLRRGVGYGLRCPAFRGGIGQNELLFCRFN
jgi:hypothetical protein